MITTPEAFWSSRALRLLEPAAVVCAGVQRHQGRARLLDGVNLRVAAGARLLMVGLPDAAPTLLLKILAGLRSAEAGRIELAGLSRADDSPVGWARRVAYAGREQGIYPWLTAREALRITASLVQLERREARRRVEHAIEYWRLEDGLDRAMARNGAAYQQRAAMAAALLGDAEVVLLDEPLPSVDVGERARLLRLPGVRRTMILASRRPSREAGIVDQVVLLRGGRTAVHAPVTALEEHRLPMTSRGIAMLADRIGEPMRLAQPHPALGDHGHATA